MNQCIKQIRTILGDNTDNPVYVETLPRKGYRFLAPVVTKTIEAPAPRLVESTSGIHASNLLADRVPGLQPDPGSADTPVSSKHVAAATATAVALAIAPKPAPAPAPLPSLKPARNWSSIVSVTVIVVGLLAGIFYWHTRKAISFSKNDTLVLADFSNTTGDPVFDDALNAALPVEFGQTPYLNLLSPDKVSRTVKLLDESRGTANACVGAQSLSAHRQPSFRDRFHRGCRESLPHRT